MRYYIKAVSKTLSPKGHKNFSFEVGKEYSSKGGYCFCDEAKATLEYYGNPLETRYLEVAPLSEVTCIGDPHSFRADEIKIVREVERLELRENFFFNSACKHFEENEQ